MDMTPIMRAWPAVAPRIAEQLTAGANNTVYLVDGNAGRYVLRVYRNHADSARLASEYKILRALLTVDGLRRLSAAANRADTLARRLAASQPRHVVATGLRLARGIDLSPSCSERIGTI